MRNFLYKATTKYKFITVVVLCILLVVANGAAIIGSLLWPAQNYHFWGRVHEYFYLIFLAPQFLSLLAPISKTYPLIILLESSLIMGVIWFFTKPKKTKEIKAE